MPELVLHVHTRDQLAAFTAKPGHAVLISGSQGMGKASLATRLAESLLDLKPGNLAAYPHVRHLRPADGRAIGIEVVRDLEHFMSLKIPGNRSVARIAIIEDAHLLTIEAQNALLKTLEEPPADTVLILTSSHEQALLPTIRSRVQTISAKRPPMSELSGFFMVGLGSTDVQQALKVSGGLPGLTAALLDTDSEHPLKEAVQVARSLLQKSNYERLMMVDELARRRDFCRDVCFVLLQMSQVALTKSSNTSARWQAVMKVAYAAQEQLLQNGQPKLVLTNLMLQL
ncbi:MAG TPA: hypothetical protein VLG13_03175 [Patescibacteria group bacterium]|nr:hypothetical protein [Patescibacteria group bacterium]